MAKYRTPHKANAGIRISAVIGQLAGRLVTTASATYARIGIGSLEAKVLLMVADQCPSINSRIAEVLGVDRSAVSRTVKALVASGALEKPTGERLLTLTPKGQGLCGAIRIIELERQRRVPGDLTDAEQAKLVQYLDRLWANTPELIALAQQRSRVRKRKDD